MENLKVIAHLFDGRVNSNDGLFNLDSILAYAWMKQNHPDELLNSKVTPDNLIEPELPLEKDRDGRWVCSVGFYHEYKQQIEYWNRRINDQDAAEYVDFGKRRGKIDGRSGIYKAYRMPQIIRVISDIEFYCKGDAGGIKSLLLEITNVGKKASQGYGAIKAWTVEPTGEWENKYGIMRYEPFTGKLPDDGNQYQVRPMRLKPPYHLVYKKVPCLIPNVRRDELAQSEITDHV